MNFLVVLTCLVAATWCAPADTSDRELPALRHEEVHDEYGQYALRYITAENTVVSESGRLIPTDDGDWVLAIEGQYEFVGDDGKTYINKYNSGSEGFQVDSNHI